MDKCDIAGGQLGCGETCDIRSGYLDCAVAEAAYAEGHSRWGIVWIAVAKVCCRDRVAGAFQNRGSQISGDNRFLINVNEVKFNINNIRPGSVHITSLNNIYEAVGSGLKIILGNACGNARFGNVNLSICSDSVIAVEARRACGD